MNLASDKLGNGLTVLTGCVTLKKRLNLAELQLFIH